MDANGLDAYLLTLLMLAIVFFPGIIGAFVLLKLKYCRNRGSFFFLAYSFVIGIAAYSFIPVIQVVPGKNALEFSFPSLSFAEKLINGNQSFFFSNVIYATIWSILIVTAYVFCDRKRFITKIAGKLGISNRFEDDIWNFVLTNDIIEKNNWVVVRNKPRGLLYSGRLIAFSDSFKEAEVLLSEVQVFDNNAVSEAKEPLYESPYVYLSLDPTDIEIEFFN